ncbi:MAG: NAD-dependent epimerase/dehydratase family protein [Thermomicrobiales bacterium]
MARILVTGAAGFIGSFVSRRLLARGDKVLGIDNLSPYYDVTLKADRLARLTMQPGFTFHRLDLANREETAAFFVSRQPDAVIHLAAQAGVRFSLTNPGVYVDANLAGFGNVLEGSRKAEVQHLVFASSSSVYGASATAPFSTDDRADQPVSFYAATKRANELMAYAYSHTHGLPTSGLRYFTAYGPWGRPDMAYFGFTKAILAGEPITLHGDGEVTRDFTYIDDATEATVRVLDAIPTTAPPYRVLNVGSGRPIGLHHLVEVIEQHTGKRAIVKSAPLPLADVPTTHADVTELERVTGFRPATPIEDGLAKFVEWYRDYYRA